MTPELAYCFPLHGEDVVFIDGLSHVGVPSRQYPGQLVGYHDVVRSCLAGLREIFDRELERRPAARTREVVRPRLWRLVAL